jgi:hypothetical protein
MRSPRTIPQATEIPFFIPSVTDRVTTKATLALGIAAKTTIVASSVIIEIVVIFLTIKVGLPVAEQPPHRPYVRF